MSLILEGTVSEDGHLLVELPPNTPPGQVRVSVEPVPTVDFAERNRKLLAWLEELHADPTRKTRTREEIDAYLQAERDAWDWSSQGASISTVAS